MRKTISLICLAVLSFSMSSWALTCSTGSAIAYQACGNGKCYAVKGNVDWNSGQAFALNPAFFTTFVTGPLVKTPAFCGAYYYPVGVGYGRVVCVYQYGRHSCANIMNPKNKGAQSGAIYITYSIMQVLTSFQPTGYNWNPGGMQNPGAYCSAKSTPGSCLYQKLGY